MGGIAEGIKYCIQLLRYIGAAAPYIGGGDYQIFRESAVPVHAHTLGVPAVFLMSLQAVPAPAAGDMAFPGYQVPYGVSVHPGTDLHNLPHIFVSGRKAYGNCVLRPLIPLIDMYVCTADGCFVNFNLHIIWSYFRNRDTLHPEPGFRLFLC